MHDWVCSSVLKIKVRKKIGRFDKDNQELENVEKPVFRTAIMAKGPSNIERRPFGIKELKLSESVKHFKRQRLLLDASFSLLIIFRVIITTATLTLKSPVETRQ